MLVKIQRDVAEMCSANIWIYGYLFVKMSSLALAMKNHSRTKTKNHAEINANSLVSPI